VRRVAAVVVATLLLAACGTEGTLGPQPPERQVPTAAPTATPVARGFGRVAVVVMENKEYGQIIGSRDAPFLNRLAAENALATNFFAITRPSLPNYIALLGGDTYGIHTNCTSCRTPERNLVDQLEESGISWKAYMEGAPSACFLGPQSGRYAKKHNPFVYYDTITRDPARCAKVVPLTELDRDIASRTVPRFVWVTPDLCNDMHDCAVEVGDRFLQNLVPRILEALGPRGVLFLTFDEGATTSGCCEKAAGGHIVTIAAGPAARPGRYEQPLNHYSLLRAIEDGFALPRLGNAACACTPSMDPMFRIPLSAASNGG
jgi:hypothetical protein